VTFGMDEAGRAFTYFRISLSHDGNAAVSDAVAINADRP
jgi:hypothetical protein